MAKKKSTILNYKQYQNMYGDITKGPVSYDRYQQWMTQKSEEDKKQKQLEELRKQQLRQQSEAKTKAWQQAYNDAKNSPDGIDRSYQVYAAKLMSETPGALEKEQARQRRMSTAETEKMQKLVQDLQYGYGGRYDPALAYQAAQMGVKADNLRSLVNKTEKEYRALDSLMKEYNDQKNSEEYRALRGLSYQGVKDNRQKNNTGYNYTIQQEFEQQARNRENQAKGLLNRGNDPFWMDEAARTIYRNNAEQTAADLRAKIKEYEQWDQDAALSGLYEKFYQKDLANEQTILDNPVYKGTPYETNAQARKAELESGYNAGWREATERAQRLLDSGEISLEGKTPEEQRQIRRMVYEAIMPDSYDDRIKTKRDQEEAYAIIDEYIAGLNAPWGKGSQGDAISALEREASAYDSQVKAADEAQKYYDFMDRFRTLADGMDYETGYNENLLPALPKMIYNQSADDFVPVPQGSEIDKAYWYANNWQTMGNYKDNMLGFESKYMFIASDPEILKMFNEFYAKDHENQLDRLHGLTGTNYTEQFLKGLDPYLSTMLVDYQDKKIRSMSENPVSGIPMRIVSPIMNAAGGVAGTLGALTGQKKDSNMYLMSRIVSSMRSQQNEDVGEWADRVFGGGGDIAKFMLGVVDSIADNVFAMGTGNALAGQGTNGAMRLVQLIMSGSATSNKMIESLDANMDPTEAALYAVGDGVIEWLTERYSLERIMGPDMRQLWGNKRAMASFILRSAGAEGSEEIASDLLNMGLDSILSLAYGHEDEIKKRYNELVTQYHMSDEEATAQALEEKLREIGLSGLAGALSGLGMAGSRVVSTALETGRQGQNVQKASGGMDTILKLAQQMKEGTESRSLADQLSAEIEKGSAVSNYDLGRLANLTALDVGEARSQVIHETVNRNVQQQLMDAGIGETEAKQYGDIITRSIFEGKMPSKADIRTLSQDERAIKLWTDFNTISEASRNMMNEVKANTKELDSIADKVGELVTPEEKQQSAAAQAVIDSMRGSSSMEEAIDKLQAKNSGLMSEGYAKLAKQVLQENPEVQKSQGYLDDIMKIRLAAMTGDRMPKTKLDSEIAQRFFDAAKNEFDEVDQNRVVPQAPAEEGQGVATYNGAEYGTQAWKDATQGLSKMTRNVMGAVGEIAARFGQKVNLVNDPDNPDVYGFEDAETGAITINVANGFKHHMLVTMAHEMTHWLEQNSRGGYDDLRSFVLDGLRAQGVNVQERIVKIMDNYNMVMKPEAGKGMTINQAMAELVAQSSEGLLSSRRAATELQNTNPGLFNKVKSYVTDIVARINNALQSMEYDKSLSYEAQALKNYRDQLADVWFNARKDAQGNVPAVRAEEGQKSFSVAQKGNKKGSLSAAADPLSPASTSETTAGITSESIVTQEEEAVKRAQEEKLDEEYIQAIADGDEKKQLRMIRDKLMNAEGIYPFYAPQLYKGHAVKIAKAIKAGDMKVITTAAGEMAKYVPDNAVLIPMPGHTGIVTDDTDTMMLAKELSRITGKPVINALQGNERESRYVSKSKNRKGVTAEQMGLRQIRNLPEGAIPVIIDNVVAVGETAKAAIDAIPGSTVLSYAKGATENVTRGLKAAFATKDKEGNWIPLSKKGDINNPNWRYSVAKRDEAYMQAVDSGNVEKQQAEDQKDENLNYSIEQKNYKFADGLDENLKLLVNDEKAFNEKNTTNDVVIGGTLKALIDIGLMDKPMVMSKNHLKDLIVEPKDKNHELTIKELKTIIRKANNPVMIIRSNSHPENSVVCVVDYEINGNTVIVPVQISTTGTSNNIRIDVNRMSTAHGRENIMNMIEKAVEVEKGGKEPGIYYVNKNKANYFSGKGLQLPNELKRYGLWHMITENANFGKQTMQHPKNTKNERKRMNFSLANAVEERADGLVAVHNLGEEQLMKVLQLGGFAMPSIAIIKNDNPYNKYGKISVVFGPDTIDPKAYRTNRVYGGDAWTPVYPKVEYKLNSNKLFKVLQKIRDILPENYKHANLVDLYEVNLSENVNRFNGAEDITKAIGSDGMKWLRIAYMLDNGKEINYPKKTAQFTDRFDNDQVILIANMLGQELVEEATKDDPWGYAVHHPELVEQIRQALNDQYREKLQANSRIRKLDIYNDNNYNAASVEYILRGAKKYFQKGITETTDLDALDKTLKETIDETDFKKWVNDLFKGVIGKSGIRNNKDYYTNAGNPRSWEQLHDEETLDNVVRIMREQEDKGENAFFGQSAILARGTRNFNSLDEIREHKEQLQVLDEEDYSNLKHNIVDQFSELMDQLYDRRESNVFIARDRVIEAIADAVKGSRTIARITKVMNDWGFHPSEAQAQKIIDLMEEIYNLPTEYFEAKPQRAVGIDEIVRVILPENTSQELKDALDNWGVEYETYNGTDEDRLAKLNAVPNVQFSIAQGPDQDVDSFMMGLNEFNLPTAQEKTMLRQYKGHKQNIKLLEEKIRTREKERDAILAKGRLDPAKQEEIDRMNAVVREARAKTEQKQRDLLEQNNKLIQERMAIQKEGRLTTEEKARLKEINQQISRNSDEINGSSYDLSQLIRNTEAQKKALRQDAKVNAYDSKKLSQINAWLQNDRARLNQMEKELVRITSDKGYARMMKNQRNLMTNLVNGQTASDLETTVNAIQKNLDNVTREMAERAENLKKLAGAEDVLKVRQMFDSRGLKRIAAKLKSDLGSELENKEIENRLALIALKMKQGKYDAETAEELADMLAGRMKAENAGYIISELRGSTIVLSENQLKELKGEGKTLADVKAVLAGTGIRISTKGSTTLDSKWDELCDIIPTLDRNENAGNMLNVLLDKISSEKAEQATVYNDEQLMETNRMVLEAAQKLIPEIIKDENSLKLIRETLAYVARVSGAAKTAAEAMDEINNMISQLQKKSEKAIFTAKKLTGDIGETIEYFDQLSLQSEAAMWKQERLALIDQLKSENTQNLLKEAEKWKERIARDKTAREKMGENLQLRKQITTNVSRIKKLLINETDQKNITEHMKSLAREMLGRIVNNDLGGRKITGIAHSDLVEIGRVLNIMDKTENRYTPDDLKLMADEEAQAAVADALADLEEGIAKYNSSTGKDVITNLDAFHDALDQISDAVSTISSVIAAENRLSFLDRQVPIWDAAEDIRQGFAKSRFKGELAGKGRKALGSVKQALYYGNMTPEYFIKNLDNRAFSELWKEAQEGENRNGLELQKAKAYLQALADKTNYKQWANEKKTMQVGGKQMQITIGNIMELYAILTREKTLNPEMSQHILKGGVYFENNLQDEGKLRKERQIQRPLRVTEEEISDMYAQLTEEQKTYLDSVVSYLSNEMSQLGNEASMRMYGIRKYKETYYFPMKVWDGVKSARSDKGITGASENRAAHKSWSKRRINMARNPLVIGDFTADAVNHIVEMINYNTMAPAIENINKVLNYKMTENDENAEEIQRNIRIMFQEAYGRDALNYLETLLKDMNGGVAQDQRKTLRDRALSMFKKNAVAGSLSVALQQPLSYIRASMLINPKYLAPGIVANNWKDSYTEMMKYSGVAVIKKMGRFDMNFGQSAKDYITPETRQNLYNRTSDMLTAAPEKMDAMTWTWMWGAVKAETKAKHPGADVNSENFMKEVARRFNEVMRRTQVYDSVLVKSSNMRSQNLGMKVLTSFMAEPTLSLNVLADAIRNTGAEGGKKNLAKALATFFISAVFQAGVKGLMGSGRTPDKKKTWLENFMNKFQYNLMNEANPVSLIPGYSDLIEVLKTGELQDDAMGAIGKLTSIIDTMRKAAEGNGRGAYRDLEDTVGQFAQLFSNIPAKNLMRDARAMYNWIAGSEYADRATSGNVLKYQAEANFFNGDNLLGTINAWLGEAGFVTSSKRYYSRIYDAMKNGDQGTANGLKEYMSLAKGVSDKAIETGIKSAAKKDESLTEAEKDSWLIKNDMMGENNVSTVTTQYKEGKITAAEAKKLWKQLDPKLTDNDLYWKQDRIDYQKETGAESVSGYNYRLKDAIKSNKSEAIKKAVKNMLDHGRTQKQIKSALSEWKSEYLAADSKGKTAIRDAIQKAYKAMGLTAADADKVINSWTKEKKKTTK